MTPEHRQQKQKETETNKIKKLPHSKGNNQ